MNAPIDAAAVLRQRVAVDIGSTVVKVARVVEGEGIVEQSHHPRDFRAGIATQVRSLLDDIGRSVDDEDLLLCSSANGGLRVGIVSLTAHFSGSVLRHQVLLAGANPLYVVTLGEGSGQATPVDLLIVGGGIDCADPGPLAQLLDRFDPTPFRFAALAYAGNRHLAGRFLERFPGATIVGNPIAESLAGRALTVFDAVRRAYLDDLVYKEGVSELGADVARGIRPTPEVVSAGFQRMLANASSLEAIGPCVLFDIGGATTDAHYAVEMISADSLVPAPAGNSAGRYVFTDLGIVASRESTVLQLRTHPRLHAFLRCVGDDDVTETYRALREGDLEPEPRLLSYACLFLALDRFLGPGHAPGLPKADPARLAHVLLTGGAAQALSEDRVARLASLFMPARANPPVVEIDRRYQIWVDGITWGEAERHVK